MATLSASPTDAKPLPTRSWLRWLHGPWGVAALVGVVYSIIYTIWTFTHWGGEDQVTRISDLAQLPMALFAALASFRIWRSPEADRATRLAWSLIGLGLLFSFFGELLWFNYEIIQQTSPFPSWADAGYLLFYPLIMLGLINLPYAPLSRPDRVRLYLDVAIVVVGSAIVIWQFILGPTTIGFMPSLEGLLAAAYPLADLAIIAGLVYFLFRHPYAATRSGFEFFTAGMVLFVVADMIFGIQSLNDQYASGSPLDSLWTLSYLLFALAALQQRASLGQGSQFQTARRMSAVWALPYVMLALACGLVVWAFVASTAIDHITQGLLVGLLALVALISLRQVLDVRENRRLSAELRLRLEQLEEAGSALNRAQHLAGIGTLAAGVAHEINNPLSVVISNVEALRRRLERGPVDSETIRTVLQRVERAAWHGARIARSLLTYAHGADVSLSRATAAEIVADALALANLPPDGPIQLKVTVAPDTPPIICDRGQIAQVLVNLMLNARDAITPPGTIEVTAGRGDDGGLALVVIDTGSGMEPSALARAFDPFFTTKPIGEGTGLGLSICRGIIRAHDGDIDIQSTLGQGTRVAVRLPPEPHPRASTD